jgi:hypothetical protein
MTKLFRVLKFTTQKIPIIIKTVIIVTVKYGLQIFFFEVTEIDGKIVSATIVRTKMLLFYIVFFFKFHLKVGVEESIVNAPRITDDGSAV